ncbi:hypothetical protein P2H44_02710 [Albimonas sp. CAU 1670]|uniref:hypothetical protein n=1 Tax=Albimonas sp. CAU 1670 TaxID=3032599 RepID=UPI0023DC727C|nr:hypothetical protein [Albimonas sp. CAU 1670]MDF2231456.1 hypothetical protein [Albimonas sp. CAU 1670]
MIPGLLFAAIFPFAPLGMLAGALYAVANPPLMGLTGIGRWDVHLAFSAMGTAVSLWVVLGPTLAAASLLARLAGLRSALAVGPTAWLVVFVGLSLYAGGGAAGGLGAPGAASEVVNWAMILVVPSLLGAAWTVACVAFAQRLRLRVERRGLEPGANDA